MRRLAALEGKKKMVCTGQGAQGRVKKKRSGKGLKSGAQQRIIEENMRGRVPGRMEIGKGELADMSKGTGGGWGKAHS